MVTLFTCAAVPAGLAFWTDLGSKLTVASVVLTFKNELWMVYLGVKGDRSSS
jgi:hypothetical protein